MKNNSMEKDFRGTDRKRKSKHPRIWYILTVVEILSALVVIVSLGVLAYYRMDYKKGETFYEETQQQYTAPAVLNPKEEIPEEDTGLSVDFAGLQAQNPEITGWIDIPRLGLSYPILQASDNDKYLHTMYTGEYNRAGSIFEDAKNSKEFTDALTILYGHNMDNGSMFARVLEYQTGGFGQNSDRIYIYLPGREEPLVYRPFACAQLADDDEFYFSGYQLSDSAYGAMQTRMLNSSPYLGEFVPNADQRTLALSTCTRDGKQRVVLFAAQVAE